MAPAGGSGPILVVEENLLTVRPSLGNVVWNLGHDGPGNPWHTPDKSRHGAEILTQVSEQW